LHLACCSFQFEFLCKEAIFFPLLDTCFIPYRHNFIDLGASELEPLVGPEVADTMLEELQGEEKIQHEILSKEEKPQRR
jgi:hypothetical protein